jgi:hypothetical protein
LLGTPLLTLPAMLAGVMSIGCWLFSIGLRELIALIVAMWLALWLAAVSMAWPVVVQVMLQQADGASQVAWSLKEEKVMVLTVLTAAE